MTTKSTNNKCKQSLYFPDDMLGEIKAEASRLDRSLSWMLQKAWKIARKKISAIKDEPIEGSSQQQS